MLDRIEIENFRCLRSVSVPLRPLTVLVGPNDSGKSAFLAAMRLAARPVSEPPTREDYWHFDERTHLEVAIASGGQRKSVTYIDSGTDVIDSLGNQQLGFYSLPNVGPPMSGGGYADSEQAPILSADGTGVPALVDHFLRRDRERFFEYVVAMKLRVPGLHDILVVTPEPASRRLDLLIDGGFRMCADSASAGVRLLFFFVALSYHPNPPDIILLEEPENGVHPRRLADVMALLRDITQGKHCGHAAQVILTTHSPYLLDHVDLKTDQVLVFRRNDDGSRSAEPADAERLKTFLDEFMLGEVWFNQGEDGLVGRKA